MNRLTSRLLGVSALALLAGVASAQVAVDGVLGGEWAGSTPVSVLYNANAATSNFDAPTNESNTVAYDIYHRTDGNYVYGLLQAKPAGAGNDGYDSIPGTFANFYFDTDPAAGNGADFLFEFGATNPSVINTYDVLGNDAVPHGNAKNFGVVAAFTTNTNYANGGRAAAVEFAVPVSYFMNDPQNVGFTKVPAGGDLLFRLSQSFSYSVAGGPAYGADRLGRVTLGQPVPEPATMAALGLGALGLLKRRRKAAK